MNQNERARRPWGRGFFLCWVFGLIKGWQPARRRWSPHHVAATSAGLRVGRVRISTSVRKRVLCHLSKYVLRRVVTCLLAAYSLLFKVHPDQMMWVVIQDTRQNLSMLSLPTISGTIQKGAHRVLLCECLISTITTWAKPRGSLTKRIKGTEDQKSLTIITRHQNMLFS